MNLTNVERLSFINQMKILEKLYPENAEKLSQDRIALENGFSLHYEWIFEGLHEEMSKDDCSEILDILDMYRAITFSLRKMDATHTLHEHRLAKFKGFDGNNERQHLDYVWYFIVELGRYDELKVGKLPTFNSHTRMLSTYKKMLKRWVEDADKSYEMSADTLASVLG